MIKHRHILGIAVLVLLGIFLVRLFFTDVSDQYVSVPQQFVVYFAARDQVGLMPEYRYGSPSIYDRLKVLIKGPYDKTKLDKVLPLGTTVISFQIENELLYVNLSKEFVENHLGGSSGELITIYGLVNTLTEDPLVRYVQILVEGQKIDTLAGHVDVSRPLYRDDSLIIAPTGI